MKIQELKENTPLEVIKITHKIKFYDHGDLIKDEFDRFKSVIYTDGNILKESDETVKKIKNFCIGSRVFNANRLKTKKIYFENYSYIIVFSISNESFDDYTTENVLIYLKDKKDKKALKRAKEAIKIIKKDADLIYCPKNINYEIYETNKISNNVYTLRKTK